MRKDEIQQCVIGVCVLIFVVFFVKSAVQQDIKNEKSTYEAWEKYTGNESKMTYYEWRLLKRRDLLHSHPEIHSTDERFGENDKN